MTGQRPDGSARRVYWARPYVWVGPVVGVSVLFTFGILAQYPMPELLIILAIEGVPSLLIILASLRTRTVLVPDGLWLCRTFSKRFVTWESVSEIGLRRASWAGNETITLTVADKVIRVPGPFVGVFAKRYGRAVVADFRRARSTAVAVAEPSD